MQNANSKILTNARVDPDFATIKDPKKMAPEKANAQCLTCHEKGKQAMWKASMHEAKGLACSQCHSVHKGHGASQLAKADAKDVCYQCHKDVKSQANKTSHHPIKEGKMTCASCHNPHGTAGPHQLTANTLNEKCYECHAEKRGPFFFEHRPVSEDCSVCHTPHGSKYGKLLTSRNPYLCQSCHSNSRHPGTIYAVDPGTAGSNTYQKLNNRILARGCLNCHQNIHGSNHPSGKTFAR
ncbi:MAG: DmsE family decaheme c-type cytochrome [Elusimicrobia bacterium]|nr:DmsE family decaheme c-type cytochrome [Elusimicrobiota bacterium]